MSAAEEPDRKVYSLHQIGAAVKRRIEDATQGQEFWVRAEVAQLRERHHAYLELVEHRNGAKVAVMKGLIWHDTYQRIRLALGAEHANVLKEGAEILFRAALHYHPVHGLSLWIDEVDLSFSLGELERRKQETIAQLKAEGLFDLNRAVPEPLVIQRVALVTSAGSAAYQDFMQHLARNEYGYRFHVRLFPATVQGDTAATELAQAVAAIDPAAYDAVVLIRGGGSKLDLEPFNDLGLCRLLARLPIPVLTGIGHDVDVSVADLVARGPHKTPTAVADHLVDKCVFFETQLNGFLVSMQHAMQALFTVHKERMAGHAAVLRERPPGYCRLRRGELHTVAGQFGRLATARVQRDRQLLAQHTTDLGRLPLRRVVETEPARLLEMRNELALLAAGGLRVLQAQLHGMHEAVRLLAPEKLLARGYSITRREGEALRDAADLRPGDEILTELARGRAWSTVTRIEPHG
jgi:exodeoxyribonuclease VII large subunit